MKIGFIGAGNMGGALAKAVRAALPDCEIYISDMSTEKAAALAAVLKGKAVSNERCKRVRFCLFRRKAERPCRHDKRHKRHL